MTAEPNRVCNARGRGRPTSNGGNGLGLRGLANSQATKPSTRHQEWARPGSETMGVACKAPKVARKTNAADVQTLPIIFAASGMFWGYNVFQL